MYIPKHTLMEDAEEIQSFIEKNSFAILVTANSGRLIATHLPVLIHRNEGKFGTLYCHISKANDQWKDMSKEVLVIFPGAHQYISSSWYETDQSVPTWNYLTVHAYGEIEITDDYEEKSRIIKEMVNYFEDGSSSYKTENLDLDYFDRQLKGITVFKIKITKLEGKKKLSQNHSAQRQERVIKELEKSDNPDAKEIAELMKENLKKKI